MSGCLPSSDLLHDLEQRQDEVLAQLDELNARIERVIAEFRPAADGIETAEASPARQAA